MKIGFVGADTNSLRVRAIQLRPPLEKEGHQVHIATWSAADRRHRLTQAAQIVRLARWCDVCVMVKPRLPPPLLRVVAAMAGVLVVDIDDATFEYSESMRQRLVLAGQHSRAVVVGSDHLAERCSTLLPDARITVIRPSVDVRALPHRGQASIDGPLRIGWIGTGEHLHTDFTEPVRQALARVSAQHDVVLEIISDRPLDVDGVRCRFTPWSQDAEGRLLVELDIGIMPLADDPISLGRCGLKCIQYMAAGLPVVAATHGAGGELVADGHTGLLAATSAEWEQALGALITTPVDRATMGRRARDRAEQLFSIEQNVRELVAVVSTP
jgi:glycosyltransferase involved in cell wall biosynthesis